MAERIRITEMKDKEIFHDAGDSFFLGEDDLFLLRGWIAKGVRLGARFEDNGNTAASFEEVPFELEILCQRIDERYHGYETLLTFHFEGGIPAEGALALFASEEASEGASGDDPDRAHNKKCYQITAEEMRFRMAPLKTGIRNTIRTGRRAVIRGWAAALEAVTIAVLEDDGTEIPFSLERYICPDVFARYGALGIDKECGFQLALDRLPERTVHVRLRAGASSRVEDITPEMFHRENQLAPLVQKGKRFLHRKADALRDALSGSASSPDAHARKETAPEYTAWLAAHLPDDRQIEAQRRTSFAYMPLISVVMYPGQDTARRNTTGPNTAGQDTAGPDMAGRVPQLVRSVLEQSYANWEMLLTQDAFAAYQETCGGEAFIDSRIRPLAIADAANDGPDHDGDRIWEGPGILNAAVSQSRGAYIAAAGENDRFGRNAFFEVVRVLNQDADAKLLYADEDEIDAGGQLCEPNFKPDYDPDYLNAYDYIGSFLLAQKDLLCIAGLAEMPRSSAWQYDLLLRCTEKTDKFVHIPMILYHRRRTRPDAVTNVQDTKAVLAAHYQRLGLTAEVHEGERPGVYRTRYQWEEEPLVSILIPNKDHARDLERCIRGFLTIDAWANIEVIVIENNSTSHGTFLLYDRLERMDPRIRVVTYRGGFNYAAINNFGAGYARGTYLLLLNNDTECISHDVIGELMSFAQRGDVGAVGARLYYPDDTIQHAGVIVGLGGIAGHAFVGSPLDAAGYQNRIICEQDYSALTAACLMVRKEAFDAVQGFDETLAVAFNDVDLCLKIRREGYRIVYDPYCRLYHYESKTRGSDLVSEEKIWRFKYEEAVFRKKWNGFLRQGDPYYNPNLSLYYQDFTLARN